MSPDKRPARRGSLTHCAAPDRRRGHARAGTTARRGPGSERAGAGAAGRGAAGRGAVADTGRAEAGATVSAAITTAATVIATATARAILRVCNCIGLVLLR